jgi:hypothetical protein
MTHQNKKENYLLLTQQIKVLIEGEPKFLDFARKKAKMFF